MPDLAQSRSMAVFRRMLKHKITFKTFSQATKNIARKLPASALVACALLTLTAQTPATPSLVTILRNHVAALRALHVRAPKSHETTGKLEGLGQVGSFHEWQDGDRQRRDERLGLQTQHQLRIGDDLWIQNASGQIREAHGIVARRQITQDFIDSNGFASHPEAVRFLERAKLADGRTVYHLQVTPPNGEVYGVGIDAKSWLIDEETYNENDSTMTVTLDDYHVVDGMLLPYKEIDNDGDARSILTSTVESVAVDKPIAADIFKRLTPNGVNLDGPVTVPVETYIGLPFITVKMAGHSYHFLLDSGSQGNVIDPRIARELGLHPEGSIEINGAARVQSLGSVELPAVEIGTATLNGQVATVLDLSRIPSGNASLDGVLGGPFFGGAELRFDPDHAALTIAKPGSLPVMGEKIDVDSDRELVEIIAKVNRDASTRVIVDTGSTAELLLYSGFMKAHPGLVNYVGNSQVQNHGAGGSTSAVGTIVDDLQIGSYHLFNRRTDVILTTTGAFADRLDGGNVGSGVLRNFVATFDVPNHALYLARAKSFDDGRYRARLENSDLIPHRQ
jgi:hypothetical protein